MPDEGCTKCIIDTGHLKGVSDFLVFTAVNLDKVIETIGTANLTDEQKRVYQKVLDEQCELKDAILEKIEAWSYAVTDISKAHDVLYKLKDGGKK
jgi:hypothetical protein